MAYKHGIKVKEKETSLLQRTGKQESQGNAGGNVEPTLPTGYSRLLPPGGEDGDVLMFGPEGPYWESNPGSPGSAGEIYDYRLMENKPTIEDVVLDGNKTLEQLGATKITNQELEEIFNA